MITHVVMFRLKDRSPENLQKTRNFLLDLDGKIPSLRQLEVGIDLVRSERSYDLVLIAKFDNMAGLHAYQVHPAHVPVVAHMREIAEAAAAVDFES
ncbi:MAG: Dabb family protein [Chloroflexi bacterium]|nr:MAG: Dabb family protein [Chloroflexota bacterium]